MTRGFAMKVKKNSMQFIVGTPSLVVTAVKGNV